MFCPSNIHINDFDCPNLGFLIINVLFKKIKGHVRRWTDIILEAGPLKSLNLAISEIDDFRQNVVEHNVSRLKIPMKKFKLTRELYPLRMPFRFLLGWGALLFLWAVSRRAHYSTQWSWRILGHDMILMPLNTFSWLIAVSAIFKILSKY